MFGIMEHQLIPKCKNSFFDFLTSLGYLQYVVDYFTPLLPPFETLERYEKFIGVPMKLTKEEKVSIPVLSDDLGVLWIPGEGPDTRAAITDESREVILISVRKDNRSYDDR